MRTVEIDFSRFETPAQVHAYLKEQLSFPSYYGNNLDALYDVLTDISEDTLIVTRAGSLPKETIFMRVLRDAARRNSHLKVRQKPKSTADS